MFATFLNHPRNQIGYLVWSFDFDYSRFFYLGSCVILSWRCPFHEDRTFQATGARTRRVNFAVTIVVETGGLTHLQR